MRMLPAAELAGGTTMSLPGTDENARIAVRLIYTREARSDLEDSEWSYTVPYTVNGEEFELTLRMSQSGQPVYESVRLHKADAGVFEIKLGTILADQSAPTDIELVLEQIDPPLKEFKVNEKPRLTLGSGGILSWNPIEGANSYEVQWAFIALDDGAGERTPFKNRPTGTVEVVQPQVNLDLGYPAGKLYVRVRSLGSFPDSETVRYGAWSNPVVHEVSVATAVDVERNWWRTTNFDNQGTRRTVLRHYDSLLRQRQEVISSHPDGVTRVSVTVLDDEGRSALSTLKVPAETNSLKYRPDFLSAEDGEYGPGEIRSNLPKAPMPSGAGGYFRAGNNEIGVPEESHPFSTVKYSRDWRSRIQRSSGIGKILHNHASSFLYGSAGLEFSQLFGSSAGLSSNYSRGVTVDPNGQGHVRYTDNQGQLVAVGLAGRSPSITREDNTTQPVLQALPENPIENGTAEEITANIEIPPETLVPEAPSSEFSYTLINTQPTHYSFRYSLNGSTSTVSLENGQTVCPQCKYLVTIAVYGPDGSFVGGHEEPVEIGPPPPDTCGSSDKIHLDVDLVPPGEYKLVRRIELDTSIISTYFDQQQSIIPGRPDMEDIRTTVRENAFDSCKLLTCEGSECEDMVREAVERECNSLDALAKADVRSWAIEHGVDLSAADGYSCESSPDWYQGPQPDACCHAENCDATVNDQVKSKLWEVAFGKIEDWKEANARGFLDPLRMESILSQGVSPCTPSNPACLDPEFTVNSIDRNSMINYLQAYRPDEFSEDTNTLISAWAYVSRPQLGFDAKERWAAFRGIYMAGRARVLRDRVNRSSCPYNSAVAGPDLTALSEAGQQQVEAAAQAFAEHCTEQCEANVCNWRWQLADQCREYDVFDPNHDGEFDYPAYLCGPDTPIDAVHEHLYNYCIKRCGLPNPFGSISEEDFRTDPDLQAASAAANCTLDHISGGLFVSNIVCRQDCDKGMSLTACGRTLAWFINNLRLLYEDRAQFETEFESVSGECAQLQDLHLIGRKLGVGQECSIWFVDETGREVSPNAMTGPPITVTATPESIDFALRPYFTFLIMPMLHGGKAYVMSSCPYAFASYTGPCCDELARTQRLHFSSIGRSENPRNHGEFWCAEDNTNAVSSEPLGFCAKETLEHIANVLAGTVSYPRGQVCTGDRKVDNYHIVIEQKYKKDCVYGLLTPDGRVWLEQNGWKIANAEPARLPTGSSIQANFETSNIRGQMRYTGVRLTLEGPNEEQKEIYVYSNCPLAMTAACEPVGGEIVTNLPDFDFDDWGRQCKEDAETFVDSQTSRVVEEGEADSREIVTNVMTAKCMGGNLSENLSVRYVTGEYAHTLFYYDQVGNLSAIVPPAGVKRLSEDQINTGTKPEHSMLTQVEYNSRNNMVKRASPDAGTDQFLYDLRGRRRFSQTSEQKERKEWSYVRYDGLDRVIETGVIWPYSEIDLQRRVDDLDFPNQSERREVVRTHYGPQLAADQSGGGNAIEIARYLRQRVRSVDAQDSNTTLTYSYSPVGQVIEFITKQPELGAKIAKYAYDPVDDTLLGMGYQIAEDDRQRNLDEFRQRFEYDSERRLTAAISSVDGVIWEHDARYEYYDYGPRRRMALGEYEVQGVDFVHTVHGWLKAVNAGDGSSEYDPGKDGLNSSLHQYVPQDLVGQFYTYFDHDFAPATTHFMMYPPAVAELFSREEPSLYTGLIGNRTLTHRGFTPALPSECVTFEYDQLARLTASDVAATISEESPFGTRYTYDLNGNFLNVMRNGPANGECGGAFDKLTYTYAAGTNQLIHLNDMANSSICESDIDDQGVFHPDDPNVSNYAYDASGRLIQDKAEGILPSEEVPSAIVWSSTDKILATHQKDSPALVSFYYDGLDRRTRKVSTDETTFYVRHPDGRILAIYSMSSDDENAPTLGDFLLYAETQRIGTRKSHNPETETPFERVLGLSRYELTDQVGSVLAVVTDQKLGQDYDGDGMADMYTANVVLAAEYYPFGMLKPGKVTDLTESRFGFGGYERDDELKGTGQSYITEARLYDPRVGRWISPDPLFDSQPGLFKSSPTEGYYLFALGNPLSFIDPEGLAAMPEGKSETYVPRIQDYENPQSMSSPIKIDKLESCDLSCGKGTDLSPFELRKDPDTYELYFAIPSKPPGKDVAPIPENMRYSEKIGDVIWSKGVELFNSLLSLFGGEKMRGSAHDLDPSPGPSPTGRLIDQISSDANLESRVPKLKADRNMRLRDNPRWKLYEHSRSPAATRSSNFRRNQPRR